jgi:hypothetical protein
MSKGVTYLFEKKSKMNIYERINDNVFLLSIYINYSTLVLIEYKKG